MSRALQNTTVSTRITSDIGSRARHNLERQGLTVSEYLRLALIKAANGQVRFLDFLDSPEALAAKQEVEKGLTEEIGSVQDFGKWIDDLSHDQSRA